jgi:hypothetical protein
VVVFDIRLVHCSTVNLSPRFRVSMDTRWQPASCVAPRARESFRAL